MIKASELMLGDWVCYDGDTMHECHVQIDGISNEEAGVEGDWYDEWEPIPLTPEILEKNGYTRDSLVEKIFIRDEDYEPVFATSEDGRIIINNEVDYINSDNKWYVHIDTEDMRTMCTAEITYVHELQHLLRLCKIEKEIVI